MSSPSPDQTSSPLGPVICDLYNIAQRNNAFLGDPKSLLPLNVDLNANGEYQRGVLACVLQLYYGISQIPEGRQALRDLGLEPFFEDGKRPGHGGGDD